MKKPDRNSKLLGSLKTSMASEDSSLDQRFRAADEAMARTGGSLLSGELPTHGAPTGTEQISSGTLDDATIIEVRVDHVHDSPENSRDCFPSDEIEELAESMREHGQKEPAQAMPHPEMPGHWILFSGHKRKRAVIRAGIPTMRLIPQPPVFGLERYKLSLVYNKHSRESALDNARAWARLLAAGHVQSYDELAEKLGIAKSALSKTLAFNKLPERALARIREAPHRFGAAAGQLLSQIAQGSDEKELMDYVEGVIEERVTVRQLEAAAGRGGSHRMDRKAKQNSRQYRVKAGDVEIGVLKDWDYGRVSLEVTLDDPKKRAKLVDLLKSELGVA